ncbi:MAG: hypothetical protein JOZ08_22555 [Verrucomicrobia bacterium]|nr:hypothetical protein [Verrucomicrobiota bacterium]MBV8279399.1 hypothetical protein [Verrucomicrobiota bacterium]
MFRRRFVTPRRVSFFGQSARLAHKPQRPIALAAAGPVHPDAVSPFRPFAVLLLALLLLVAGCATNSSQVAPLMESPAIAQQIAAEPVGDFYIGRRVFAPPFAIWGYVRSPRQSWLTAKLVILNEKFQFAPDRARNQLGSDNGSEYRLYGYFSGDQIYDASAGRFCTEFVLKRAELVTANPDPIWSAYFIRDRQMFQGWARGGSQPMHP